MLKNVALIKLLYILQFSRVLEEQCMCILHFSQSNSEKSWISFPAFGAEKYVQKKGRKMISFDSLSGKQFRSNFLQRKKKHMHCSSKTLLITTKKFEKSAIINIFEKNKYFIQYFTYFAILNWGKNTCAVFSQLCWYVCLSFFFCLCNFLRKIILCLIF